VVARWGREPSQERLNRDLRLFSANDIPKIDTIPNKVPRIDRIFSWIILEFLA